MHYFTYGKLPLKCSSHLFDLGFSLIFVYIDNHDDNCDVRMCTITQDEFNSKSSHIEVSSFSTSPAGTFGMWGACVSLTD